MQSYPHERWSSRLTFVLATTGGAVGLGNLWRFPYVAGENGGGGFVLIYIGFVFLLGLPVMIGEMLVGRRGGQSAVATMRNLVERGSRSRFWVSIGWLSVLAPFIGLSYYSVVAAWSMDYLWLAISNAFAQVDAGQSQQLFADRIGQPLRQALLHATFIGLTVLVIARGLKRGIEFATRLMMPALFALLVILVVYNAITADFSRALYFLFYPDFSSLSGTAILMALGQALFSLAVGTGMLITYSAYLPKDVSLRSSAVIICTGDTLVAMLAGLAIFPIVFSAGLDPAGGPPLIFVTLPVAFAQMPGGVFLAPAFFLLLFVAAYTSAIGMLEPIVAWLVEFRGASRARVAIRAGLIVWVLGLASVFSFNLLADFHPLDFVEGLGGQTIFDIVDFATANLLLPLNALLISLFIGWSLKPATMAEELGPDSRYGTGYSGFAVRYLVPVALLAILIDLWR